MEAALEFVEATEESLSLGVDLTEQLRDIGSLSKEQLNNKKEFVDTAIEFVGVAQESLALVLKILVRHQQIL